MAKRKATPLDTEHDDTKQLQSTGEDDTFANRDVVVKNYTNSMTRHAFLNQLADCDADFAREEMLITNMNNNIMKAQRMYKSGRKKRTEDENRHLVSLIDREIGILDSLKESLNDIATAKYITHMGTNVFYNTRRESMLSEILATATPKPPTTETPSPQIISDENANHASENTIHGPDSASSAGNNAEERAVPSGSAADEERAVLPSVYDQEDMSKVPFYGRTENRLFDLGPDVLRWIFEHLDSKTRFMVLPLVCREFNRLAYTVCTRATVHLGFDPLCSQSADRERYIQCVRKLGDISGSHMRHLTVTMPKNHVSRGQLLAGQFTGQNCRLSHPTGTIHPVVDILAKILLPTMRHLVSLEMDVFVPMYSNSVFCNNNDGLWGVLHYLPRTLERIRLNAYHYNAGYRMTPVGIFYDFQAAVERELCSNEKLLAEKISVCQSNVKTLELCGFPLLNYELLRMFAKIETLVLDRCDIFEFNGYVRMAKKDAPSRQHNRSFSHLDLLSGSVFDARGSYYYESVPAIHCYPYLFLKNLRTVRIVDRQKIGSLSEHSCECDNMRTSLHPGVLMNPWIERIEYVDMSRGARAKPSALPRDFRRWMGQFGFEKMERRNDLLRKHGVDADDVWVRDYDAKRDEYHALYHNLDLQTNCEGLKDALKSWGLTMTFITRSKMNAGSTHLLQHPYVANATRFHLHLAMYKTILRSCFGRVIKLREGYEPVLGELDIIYDKFVNNYS